MHGNHSSNGRTRGGGSGSSALSRLQMTTNLNHLLVLTVFVVAFFWGCAVLTFPPFTGWRSRELFDNDLHVADTLSALTATVDLWPDDEMNSVFGNSLVSSLSDGEQDEEDNSRRKHEKEGKGSVGILRPPGVLGRTLEEFIRVAVNRTMTRNNKEGGLRELSFELIGASHFEKDHPYTAIIRLATVPILLDAIDLALGVVEDGDGMVKQGQEIALDDILGTVRLLVRWHCRLSEAAEDTELLTITTQMVMSHPGAVQKNLDLFLGSKKQQPGRQHPHQDVSERIEDELNGRAGKVLRRIDECSAVAILLQRRLAALNEKEIDFLGLEDLVDGVIKDEFQSGGICDPSVKSSWGANLFGDGGVAATPKTRVTESVGRTL